MKRHFTILLLLMFCVALTFILWRRQQTQLIKPFSAEKLVYNPQHVLNPSEVSQIEERCKQIKKKTGVNVFVLCTGAPVSLEESKSMAARLIRDGRPDSSDTSISSYFNKFYPPRRVVVQLYTNSNQVLLFPTWTTGNMRYVNMNGADWRSQILYPYASSILNATVTVEKRIQESEPKVAPNGRASLWVDILGCAFLKLLTLHWMASVLMRLFDSRDRSPFLPLLEIVVGGALLFAFTSLFIYYLGIIRMSDAQYGLLGISATLTWLSVACALMWRVSTRILWIPALFSFISVVFLIRKNLADGGKNSFMSSTDLIRSLMSPLDGGFLIILGFLTVTTFVIGLLINYRKAPLTYQVWRWINFDKHIQLYTGKPSQIEEYKSGFRGYLMTSAPLNFYWLYVLELLAIVSSLSYLYRKIGDNIEPGRTKWFFKILLCTTPGRCRDLAFARFSLSIASHFRRKGDYIQALIWVIACQDELDRTPNHNKEILQWKRRTLLLLSEINAATGRYNAAFYNLNTCLKLVSQYSYRSQFEVLTTQMRLYAELRMWSESLASGYAAAALLMRLETRYGNPDSEKSPSVTEENVKADPLFLTHSDIFSSAKFMFEIDSLIVTTQARRMNSQPDPRKRGNRRPSPTKSKCSVSAKADNSAVYGGLAANLFAEPE